MSSSNDRALAQKLKEDERRKDLQAFQQAYKSAVKSPQETITFQSSHGTHTVRLLTQEFLDEVVPDKVLKENEHKTRHALSQDRRYLQEALLTGTLHTNGSLSAQSKGGKTHAFFTTYTPLN